MVSFDQVTYPSAPHALPFRTICGEYRARRASDLAAAVSKHVLGLTTPPSDLQIVWTALDKALTASEEAYGALAAMKEVMASIRQEPDEPDDDFRQRMSTGYDETLKTENECQTFDHPLTQILHEMQATAVCLSGGGIRSASFALGDPAGLVPLQPSLDVEGRIQVDHGFPGLLVDRFRRRVYRKLADGLVAAQLL